MNFLAHLYLSKEIEDIMVGNFIADSIKGKAYQNFRPGIQHGILLHRKIDQITDQHRITKELSALFKEKYQRYSGIVVDIFYDHFLSQNWDKFSETSIIQFINKSYNVLLKNFSILPPKVKSFLPLMIAQNRLLSYTKIEGLRKALERMSKYTSLPDASNFAIETLTENFNLFNERFIIFFNELIDETNKEHDLISKKVLETVK